MACPSCGWLVHGEALRRIAADAERATAEKRVSEALRHWRRALELLPPGSRQHEIVTRRADELSRAVGSVGDATDTAHHSSKLPAWLAGLGAAGLVLWKFKFIVIFLVTKAKFLLFGLSKAGTVSSMLLSLGVYWTVWGWKFALGLVLSIYVHEMGHVWALRRFGMHASAPMFVPGLGAFIRMKQHPVNAHEDARVGLAGPNWGLGAALFCGAVFLVTREPYWAAIAGVGAWINLFNLTPIFGLDGDRAFKPLNRLQRILALVVVGGICFLLDEGILLLVLLVGLVRCWDVREKKGDWGAFANYVLLVVSLTALSAVRALARF